MKLRQVKIELVHGMWLVKFVDRKPRGRHLATQFDAKDYRLRYVEAWVRQSKRLALQSDMEG